MYRRSLLRLKTRLLKELQTYRINKFFFFFFCLSCVLSLFFWNSTNLHQIKYENKITTKTEFRKIMM